MLRNTWKGFIPPMSRISQRIKLPVDRLDMNRQLCVNNDHQYGDMGEHAYKHIVVVAKKCRICTHLLYKWEWLEIQLSRDKEVSSFIKLAIPEDFISIGGF